MDTAHPIRRRVLVVDDDLEVVRTLSLLLGRWGYEPVVAFDGPAALAVAAAGPPAAVLLECALPGMNGYELARRLRGLPCLGGCLLIALTACAGEEMLRRCAEAGIDMHLRKTCRPEALRKALEGRLAAPDL
jgi:two-component system CheB/CheR fusion protein